MTPLPSKCPERKEHSPVVGWRDMVLLLCLILVVAYYALMPIMKFLFYVRVVFGEIAW